MAADITSNRQAVVEEVMEVKATDNPRLPVLPQDPELQVQQTTCRDTQVAEATHPRSKEHHLRPPLPRTTVEGMETTRTARLTEVTQMEDHPMVDFLEHLGTNKWLNNNTMHLLI